MTKETIPTGDEEIFRSLYEPLRRFASVVGPWEADPDDLVQEALLRTLRSGPLSRLDSPDAYLRRAVLSISYNQFRKRDNRTKMLRLASAGSRQSNTDVYPSDLSDLMAVSPIDRAVLYLHDVLGYSFGEVATVVGKPEGTCRKIASRARQTLRTALKPTEESTNE